MFPARAGMNRHRGVQFVPPPFSRLESYACAQSNPKGGVKLPPPFGLLSKFSGTESTTLRFSLSQVSSGRPLSRLGYGARSRPAQHASDKALRAGVSYLFPSTNRTKVPVIRLIKTKNSGSKVRTYPNARATSRQE